MSSMAPTRQLTANSTCFRLKRAKKLEDAVGLLEQTLLHLVRKHPEECIDHIDIYLDKMADIITRNHIPETSFVLNSVREVTKLLCVSETLQPRRAVAAASCRRFLKRVLTWSRAASAYTQGHPALHGFLARACDLSRDTDGALRAAAAADTHDEALSIVIRTVEAEKFDKAAQLFLRALTAFLARGNLQCASQLAAGADGAFRADGVPEHCRLAAEVGGYLARAFQLEDMRQLVRVLQMRYRPQLEAHPEIAQNLRRAQELLVSELD